MPIGSSHGFRLLDLGKRILFAIDFLTGWIDRSTGLSTAKVFEIPNLGFEVRIPSINRTIPGWFVPPDGPPSASVLLFHGIGDRGFYWRRAQQRLAQAGISSLIFHYPGYEGNGAAITPQNMETDARSAYAWLRAQIPEPMPLFLFGFSLGSGLAAQVAQSLTPPPAGLILSEAFTTLRQGARRAARPAAFLGNLLPDIWQTRSNVAALNMPLFIVHSSGDALFPASMAEELFAAACAGGTHAELQILSGYPHDAVYCAVPEDYWSAVLDFIARTSHPNAG
jgi:alpha-beta hydrolase superfamily lysophospholipase